MNNKLKRIIENDFPYPIALEFRRLNTVDFLEKDFKRLKQLLKTAETTIHFLALISLVDLSENYEKLQKNIPESFTKEFGERIVRTSFGKWIALMRETIKIFKAANVNMFIEELTDYFIKGKNKETASQTAFNKITTIRNKLAHPDFNPTKANIQKACQITEELLIEALSNLDFIIDYPFLNVDNVSVKYFKWKSPKYNHTFAEVVGNSSEFNAYKKIQSNVINTPAVIITKEDNDNYLNLSPFIIFSDTGSNSIPDIFMYMDWDKAKTIKYKPVWNGGEFNLIGTKIEEENVFALLKIMEFFNTKEQHEKYAKYFENTEEDDFLDF